MQKIVVAFHHYLRPARHLFYHVAAGQNVKSSDKVNAHWKNATRIILPKSGRWTVMLGNVRLSPLVRIEKQKI